MRVVVVVVVVRLVRLVTSLRVRMCLMRMENDGSHQWKV